MIVDVHMAKRVLAGRDQDLNLLAEAIFGGRLQLIYGGRLAKEYAKVNTLTSVLVALDQAGLARRIDDEAVDREEKQIEHHCGSDDAHIIGLARACGARLLCTEDKALQSDFTSKGLVDRPRGKVFKNATHRHLLRTACDNCD